MTEDFNSLDREDTDPPSNPIAPTNLEAKKAYAYILMTLQIAAWTGVGVSPIVSVLVEHQAIILAVIGAALGVLQARAASVGAKAK